MPVTRFLLEERINQYISAVDRASAEQNDHQVAQLQLSIQQLVDLMERLNLGHAIPDSVVPPPLVLSSHNNFLTDPVEELSIRQANYHKALYFAEEEMSDKALPKIQSLQHCLKIINDLQQNVQAGIPVRIEEVPPPVPVPSDDEFDNNAVETLTKKISSYKASLQAAEQSTSVSDKKHIPKLQNTLRRLELLMTRAKANRPVWRRDIPPDFDYIDVNLRNQNKKSSKAKFTLLLRTQLIKAGRIKLKSPELEIKLTDIIQKLNDMEKQNADSDTIWQDNETSLAALTKQIEELEKLSQHKQKETHRIEETKDLIETRLREYTAAAIKYKNENQKHFALQQFKIVKSLQALKEKFEKGEPVDITLVPPPPRNLTLEDLPSLSPEPHTATESQGASAAALLSPVVTKHSVETQEDKLAKKLSEYLEKGVDGLHSDQTYVTIINVSQTQQNPGPIPKIPNSFKARTAVPTNENVSSFLNHQERTKQTSSVITGLQSVSALNQHNVPQQFSNIEKDSSFALSGSTDLYSRNTLDSVGFLPCQEILGSYQMPTQASSKKLNPGVINGSLTNSNAGDTETLKSENNLGCSELNFSTHHDNVHGLCSLDIGYTLREDEMNIKFSSLPILLNTSPHIKPCLPYHAASVQQPSQDTSLPNLANQATPSADLRGSVTDGPQLMGSHSCNDSIEFQDLMNSMLMPAMVPRLNEFNANASSVPVGTSVVTQPTRVESTTAASSENTSVSHFEIPTSSTSQVEDGTSQLTSLSHLQLESQPIVASSEPTVPSPSSHPFISVSDQAKPLLTTSVIETTSSSSHVKTLGNDINRTELTCLENLKYDILLKERHESPENNQEIILLRQRFESIKQILIHANKLIWEEYQLCVENELASIIKEMESLKLQLNRTELGILNMKKNIAERELKVLRESLPKLKF